ncbi:MAG: TatD family deoxyribonuclease, partial [Lancefieldella sp.]
AKVYPKDRLLTETDLPSSAHPACSIDDLLAGIERACKGLSQARGYDVQDEVIANAATLFGT